MIRFIIFILVLVMIWSCSQKDKPEIDIQGHRGCRGLFPENTLQGFQHAVSLGVHTLEMDVVINGDNTVIVSHEPFFHPDITTKPDGSFISGDARHEYNIFKMSKSRMDSFDVGKKRHPRFTKQQNMPAVKPSLAEVFSAFKDIPVHFNIEIKRNPEDDHVFHPDARRFVELVTEVVNSFDMSSRVCIQSFDIETLQIIHREYPDMTLAFLTDDRWLTLEEHIRTLGFTPAIYSPNYKLVTVPLVHLCHQSGIKIIPWTVNSKPVMRKLIRWGVDGLITDYPDRLVSLIRENK